MKKQTSELTMDSFKIELRALLKRYDYAIDIQSHLVVVDVSKLNPEQKARVSLAAD